MNPAQGKSKRTIVLIVVGVLVAVVILGGAGYALILATTKNVEKTSTPSTTPTQTVTSDETLSQGIDKLNAAVDREKQLREKAQQALNDQVKRTNLAD